MFVEAAITKSYKPNGLLITKDYCYNSESWKSEIKVLANSVSLEDRGRVCSLLPPGFVSMLVSIFSILTFVEASP